MSSDIKGVILIIVLVIVVVVLFQLGVLQEIFDWVFEQVNM